MSAKLYAVRDHAAQGEHYTRHVSAMTGEGLHAKSAIAAELAHRDMEIERLRAVSTWQPIETAPKDGTRVLLFALHIGTGSWDAWHHRHPDGRVVGLEDHKNPDALIDCWRWDEEGFEVKPPPTHWQPLPAPPEAA